VVRAAPRTIIVDINGSGNYTSIQDAINAANPCDSIHIWNGLYPENLIINKPLALIGNSTDSTRIIGKNWTLVPTYYSNGLGYYTDWDSADDIITIISDNVKICSIGVNFSFYDDFGRYESSFKGLAGMKVINSTGCIIDGCTVSDYITGIIFQNSSGNTITNNVLLNNSPDGIGCFESSNNILSNNTCIDNKWDGIYLENSNMHILSNNTMLGCTLHIEGDETSHYLHSIERSNTIDGRPVHYYRDKRDLHIKDLDAQIIFVNCSDSIVENINASDTSCGIHLINSHNNIIINNTCQNDYTGIGLFESSGNTIQGNVLKMNENHGVDLINSDGNSIFFNTLTFRNKYSSKLYRYFGYYDQYGISLNSSSKNLIDSNSIIDPVFPIFLDFSDNNNISNNELTSIEGNQGFGIYLWYSSWNDIMNNNVSEYWVGCNFQFSNNNRFTNNDILSVIEFQSFTHGLELVSSNLNQINNNSVHGYSRGFLIQSSNHNGIIINTVFNGYEGFLILGNHNEVRENSVSFAGTGITINSYYSRTSSGYSNNTIIMNNCSNNYKGTALSYCNKSAGVKMGWE